LTRHTYYKLQEEKRQEHRDLTNQDERSWAVTAGLQCLSMKFLDTKSEIYLNGENGSKLVRNARLREMLLLNEQLVRETEYTLNSFVCERSVSSNQITNNCQAQLRTERDELRTKIFIVENEKDNLKSRLFASRVATDKSLDFVTTNVEHGYLPNMKDLENKLNTKEAERKLLISENEDLRCNLAELRFELVNQGVSLQKIKCEYNSLLKQSIESTAKHSCNQESGTIIQQKDKIVEHEARSLKILEDQQECALTEPDFGIKS